MGVAGGEINEGNTSNMMWLLTSSTFWAVFAEASMKINPCSFANCSPSSVLTARLWARSHLLPISIIVIFAFACCLASSNQLAKWLNVSLLMGNTGSALFINFIYNTALFKINNTILIWNYINMHVKLSNIFCSSIKLDRLKIRIS